MSAHPSFTLLRQLIESASPESSCILWPDRLQNGYATVKVKEKWVYGHRLACEFKNGRPSKKKFLAAHTCNVKECVNPFHLRWADRRDNARDAVNCGAVKHGSQHYLAHLTEDIVREARQRYARDSSLTFSQLAEEYGVNTSVICEAIQGITWKHVENPVQSRGRVASLARGAKHHGAKLTEEDVRFIRKSRAEDSMSAIELAEHFNIAVSNVYSIIKRKIWAHID